MSPDVINNIDSISVTLNAGGMNTINIVLAFVMYGVALGIKPGTFVKLFKRPKPIFAGMLSQLVLLPLLTFLLTPAVFGWPLDQLRKWVDQLVAGRSKSS